MKLNESGRQEIEFLAIGTTCKAILQATPGVADGTLDSLTYFSSRGHKSCICDSSPLE